MEYRSKHYLLFEDLEADSWRWAVTLDDFNTIAGEAKSRGEAITQIVFLIDRAISRQKSI